MPFISPLWHRAASASKAAASSVFTGDDIANGINAATAINTGTTNSGPNGLRGPIENLLFEVLSYMGLAAVVVIVIGAILLIAGLGSDDSRERIRKILIYTFVGLLVIAAAGTIVRFIGSL